MPPRVEPKPSAPSEAERVLWSGSARNVWMPLVLVMVLGQAAVMNLILGRIPTQGLAPYLNAVHLVVVAVLQLFSQVHVRLDARELGIRYGYLGGLRQRIALERIVAARAIRLEPMDHGGWGYRGSLRFRGRAAVVVRAGTAVELDLDGGKRLSITVDDAENAARRINAAVARRGPPADASSASTAAVG
jgi:hypothetical protein